MPVYSARRGALSPGQLELLGTLYKFESMTRPNLAKELAVRTRYIPRMVHPLIASGYVDEIKGAWGDGASRCTYALTAKGLMTAAKSAA